MNDTNLIPEQQLVIASDNCPALQDLTTLTRSEVDESSAQDGRVYASINHIQCAVAIGHIQFSAKNLVRVDRFALAKRERNDQLRALFFLIGICDRLNWDFLMGVVANRLWEMTNRFSTESILRLQVADLREALSGYEREETIDFKRKADHLKAIAEYEQTHAVVAQLEKTVLVSGDQGAEAIFSDIPVYADDPVQKKRNAFVQECVRRGLLVFQDPEHISPAIDYHIIRLYLRTGRVWVPNEYLRKRLVARARVRIEAITQIRAAVAEAMRYTAWLCGIGISELNELEWLFARNACRRNRTWCHGGGETVCPLSLTCTSASMDPVMMLAEPESHHGFY